jgi:hypothetical protein
MKAVLAERQLLTAFGGSARIYRECPCALGPPWRLSASSPTDIVVTGLFVGMLDLLDGRREFRPIVPGEMTTVPQTGVPANSFSGHGLGMPLHGPLLERGGVVAVDLFNPWCNAQEIWVSLWGTLP